jgi:acyl-CoA synthetase (AMP-forming)/AMP-acid ligase II
MLVLAIIGVGGVFTGTNPSYTAAEIAHHIRASKAKYLISEPEILDPVLVAAKENNIPRQDIWIFDPIGQMIPPGWRSWKELLDFGEEDWVRLNGIETTSKTIAARLFSSGTTGLPKGTNITHCNLISQQELTINAFPRPYTVSLAL